MKLSNKYFNISLIIDNMLNKLDEEMEKFINKSYKNSKTEEYIS